MTTLFTISGPMSAAMTNAKGKLYLMRMLKSVIGGVPVAAYIGGECVGLSIVVYANSTTLAISVLRFLFSHRHSFCELSPDRRYGSNSANNLA